MGRSDSHTGPGQVLADTALGGCRRRSGSPVLRRPPCRRAVATTPADPSHRVVRAFDGPLMATAAAFPFCPQGRHPLGFVSRPARRSLAKGKPSASVTAHLLAESP